jgi:cytochrome P450
VPTPAHQRFRAHKKRVDDLVYELIKRRRTAPEAKADFLGRILAADRSLTDEEIRDEALTVMIAGFETSSTMILWTLHLLARHPQAVARLKEAGYLRAALRESLRLYPPSPLLSRRSTAPLNLGGRTFPAGTNLVMSSYMTQRDPRFWPLPEEFRPERFLDEAAPKHAYFPFSMGPRRCIGEEVALAEGEAVIGALYDEFEIDTEASERQPVCGVILHPDRTLTATLRARAATPRR